MTIVIDSSSLVWLTMGLAGCVFGFTIVKGITENFVDWLDERAATREVRKVWWAEQDRDRPPSLRTRIGRLIRVAVADAD